MTTAYETAVLADSPALYWPLDETTGSTANDLSGSGLNGTYGSTMGRGAGPSLVVGSSVSALGDPGGDLNAFVSRPGHDSGLDVGTGDFSLEFWVQPLVATFAGADYCGTLDFSSFTGAVLASSFGEGFALTLPSDSEAFAPGPLNDGSTHYLVMTRASGTLSIYADGAFVASVPSDTDDISAGGVQIFGVAFPADLGAGWDCPVAHVAWYTHAIDGTAVSAHYAAGTAGSTHSLTGQGWLDENIGHDLLNGTAYEIAVVGDGPSIYWPLDEASGATTAKDLSGSGLPGTYGVSGAMKMGPGGTSIVAGSPFSTMPAPGPGSSCGHDEFSWVVRPGNDSVMNIGTGDFSIEMWIAPSTPGTFNGAQAWTGAIGDIEVSGAFLSIGDFDLADYMTRPAYFTDDAHGFGPHSIIDGRPHHLVLTRESSALTLYADGQVASTNTSTVDLTIADTTFGVGSPNSPAGLGLCGTNSEWPVAHVAWYQHALPYSSVTNHFNLGGGITLLTPRGWVDEHIPKVSPSSYESVVLADGPAVYWPMDEQSSATAVRDASGNGYNGAYGTDMSPGGPGIVAGGLKAPNPTTDTNAYAIRSQVDLDTNVGTGDFSLEWWLKPKSGGTDENVVRRADTVGGGAGLQCWVNSGKIRVFGAHGFGDVDQLGVTTVRDGSIHHVVLTRTSGAAILYVDGAVDTSFAFLDGISNPIDIDDASPAWFGIGDAGATFDNCDGPVAHVAWYTHALSGTRVLAHYDAGIIGGLTGTGWKDEAFGVSSCAVSGLTTLSPSGWLDEVVYVDSRDDTRGIGSRTRGGSAIPGVVVDASALGHRTRSGFAFPSFITGGGGGGDTAIITQRWKLVDPLTSEVYSFDMNPNAGALPQYGRQIFTSQTTAVDGQGLVYEGEKVLATVAATGVLLERTQYDSLVAWVAKPYPVYLTDDNGVQSVIYLTKFTPTRAPLRSHPYRHTYELDYLLLESL